MLLKFLGVLQDLRPRLLAVLQEEPSIEGDAASDLFGSGSTVLEANLWECQSNENPNTDEHCFSRDDLAPSYHHFTMSESRPLWMMLR